MPGTLLRRVAGELTRGRQLCIPPYLDSRSLKSSTLVLIWTVVLIFYGTVSHPRSRLAELGLGTFTRPCAPLVLADTIKIERLNGNLLH